MWGRWERQEIRGCIRQEGSDASKLLFQGPVPADDSKNHKKETDLSEGHKDEEG